MKNSFFLFVSLLLNFQSQLFSQSENGLLGIDIQENDPFYEVLSCGQEISDHLEFQMGLADQSTWIYGSNTSIEEILSGNSFWVGVGNVPPGDEDENVKCQIFASRCEYITTAEPNPNTDPIQTGVSNPTQTPNYSIGAINYNGQKVCACICNPPTEKISCNNAVDIAANSQNITDSLIGSGKEMDPYRLYNSYQVEIALKDSTLENKFFEQCNDIIFDDTQYADNDYFQFEKFKAPGHYNGNKHMIKNYKYINLASEVENLGFIGRLEGGKIFDLKFVQAHVEGKQDSTNVGIVIGEAPSAGKVTNILIQNSYLKGGQNVGGFFGLLEGNAEASIEETNIGNFTIEQLEIHGQDNVGGAIGFANLSDASTPVLTNVKINELSLNYKNGNDSGVGSLVGHAINGIYKDTYIVNAYFLNIGGQTGITAGGIFGIANTITSSNMYLTYPMQGDELMGSGPIGAIAGGYVGISLNSSHSNIITKVTEVQSDADSGVAGGSIGSLLPINQPNNGSSYNPSYFSNVFSYAKHIGIGSAIPNTQNIAAIGPLIGKGVHPTPIAASQTHQYFLSGEVQVNGPDVGNIPMLGSTANNPMENENYNLFGSFYSDSYQTYSLEQAIIAETQGYTE